MKNKSKRVFISATTVLLVVSAALVTLGAFAYKYGLDTDNPLLVGLSPDVFGGGIMIFALFVIVFILGLLKIRVSRMKYM